MRIKVIKNCKISGFKRVPGQELKVQWDLGRNLVDSGYATSIDYASVKKVEKKPEPKKEFKPRSIKKKKGEN